MRVSYYFQKKTRIMLERVELGLYASVKVSWVITQPGIHDQMAELAYFAGSRIVNLLLILWYPQLEPGKGNGQLLYLLLIIL